MHDGTIWIMLNRDKNVWMFILHGVFDEYYIFFTDGTWTAENSGIVLRNPVNPFTGGVETLSDAPIPYVSAPVSVVLPSFLTGRRRKRAAYIIDLGSMCNDIFTTSSFATYVYN